MTARERIHGILNRQPVDRLAWTTLVDDLSRSTMPRDVRELHPLDFYRHIGCDIATFGNYGLPQKDCVPAPSRFEAPEVEHRWQKDNDRGATWTRVTPWGTLTAIFQNDHPVKHPVETLADLRVLRGIWEAGDYREQPGHEEGFARVDRLLGDSGLYVAAIDPSPVQNLLEYEMGVEHFYCLLQDHRAEVEELLAAMHRRRLREYEILAWRTPAEAVIPVENTSSTLISPEVYRSLSLPQIRDYAAVLHGQGKKMVLHMCGHLKSLLPFLRETDCDGFNATTPPPVGTTYFEDVLDFYGDDFLIFGGIFDPTVLQRPGVTAAELRAYLDHLYTPRLRRAHLLLWLGVDGLPTPLEKFLIVRDWFEERGRLS